MGPHRTPSRHLFPSLERCCVHSGSPHVRILASPPQYSTLALSSSLLKARVQRLYRAMGMKTSKLFVRGQAKTTSELPYPQLPSHAASRRALITLTAASLAAAAAPSIPIAHWPAQHLPVGELRSVSPWALHIRSLPKQPPEPSESGEGCRDRSRTTSTRAFSASLATHNDGYGCIDG